MGLLVAGLAEALVGFVWVRVANTMLAWIVFNCAGIVVGVCSWIVGNAIDVANVGVGEGSSFRTYGTVAAKGRFGIG